MSAARAWVLVLGSVALSAGAVAADTTAPVDAPTAAAAARADAATRAGVDDPRRAWQNWTLNCQGCHRPDGSGSAGTAPSLKGVMARFLAAPGGREYLVRVPGVATSPLADAPLAELLNWMLVQFDAQHLPADFQPFTAAEVGRLRVRPLRLEAAPLREALLREVGAP